MKLDNNTGAFEMQGNRITVGGKVVGQLFCEERSIENTPSKWQARHNAELIEQAFDISTKYGYSPAQLWEERNELLKTLQEVNQTIENSVLKSRNHGT